MKSWEDSWSTSPHHRFRRLGRASLGRCPKNRSWLLPRSSPAPGQRCPLPPLLNHAILLLPSEVLCYVVYFLSPSTKTMRATEFCCPQMPTSVGLWIMQESLAGRYFIFYIFLFMGICSLFVFIFCSLVDVIIDHRLPCLPPPFFSFLPSLSPGHKAVPRFLRREGPALGSLRRRRRPAGAGAGAAAVAQEGRFGRGHPADWRRRDGRLPEAIQAVNQAGGEHVAGIRLSVNKLILFAGSLPLRICLERERRDRERGGVWFI